MQSHERIEDELARLGAQVSELSGALGRMENNLDHLHNDLVAIRARMRLYNPDCHPTATDPTPAPTHEEE